MTGQTEFDLLLFWLNPDREKAAAKYETVRRRLMEIFASRGFPDADSLADVTIDRVITKVPQVADGWVGDPLIYFLAVAKKVMLEKRKPPPKKTLLPPPPPPDPDELEREDQCIERGLQLLPLEDRDLVLEYVSANKKQRQEIAERLGITLNALRIRIFQLKKAIRPTIKECLEQETS